ncbi:MAG: carboxymuconolactone decarboxylase family protein [Rhizomicrobium sp.]
MALLPYADIANAPEEVRDAMARLPRKLNIFRMWANAATCFVPALRLGGAILSRQKLKPAYRELVILWTAHLEGGKYEWAQHVPIAESAGCSKAQIAALAAGDMDDVVFSLREKLLLAFVKEVVENVRASEDLVKKVGAQFSPQEAVEVILTAGYYMMLARLTETTRIDVDPPGGPAMIEELARLR